MAYALINTVTVSLSQYVVTGTGDSATSSLVANSVSPGTVCSLIVYDGSSAYTPPDGYELRQVPDGTLVGTNIGI